MVSMCLHGVCVPAWCLTRRGRRGERGDVSPGNTFGGMSLLRLVQLHVRPSFVCAASTVRAWLERVIGWALVSARCCLQTSQGGKEKGLKGERPEKGNERSEEKRKEPFSVGRGEKNKKSGIWAEEGEWG